MSEKRQRAGVDWSSGEVSREIGPLETFLSSREIPIRSLVLALIALIIPIYIIFRAYFGALPARLDRSLIVCLLLVFTFLYHGLRRKSWRDDLNWLFGIDVILILLSIGTTIYVAWGELAGSTAHLIFQIGNEAIRIDHLVGIVAFVLVFEATRRTMGWIITTIPLAFLIYTLVSGYLPGFLYNPSVRWTYMMEMLFVEQEGLYGVGPQIYLSMIFLFLLFGTFLVETRTGSFFITLVSSVMGSQRGRPAKVAVGASAVMGTMSGSAIANTATTGAITIPLMKKIGYPAEFAAAVESVASNGGQIMPPIMGAAAFLLPAFLGISYADLVLWAATPAILYFIVVFTIVHLKALSMGLEGLRREELPDLRKVLFEGWHLLIPLVVLFYFLFAGYSITRVGFWAVASIFVLSFFKKETRLTPTKLLTTMEQSVRNTIGIGIACALISILIGVISISGLGVRISSLVVTLSGGSMVMGLVLAAIAAIFLGMGLPTLLVYTTLVIFVVPGLIELGVMPLAAHLFVLYFGVVSGITPPVCIVAFTAAGIAGTPLMKTGFAATRVGFAAYLLPFLFAINPQLLLQGDSASSIAWSVVSALLVLLLGAIALEGYLFRPLRIGERILAGTAAIALLWPHLGWQIGGVTLVVLLLILQRVRSRTNSQRGI